MKMPNRKGLLVLAILFGLLASGWVGWMTGRGIVTSYNRRATTAQVSVDLHMLAGASQSFYEIFGRWPVNPTELTNNLRGVSIYAGPVSDPWGRAYAYVPPTMFAAGVIGTYGADGQ